MAEITVEIVVNCSECGNALDSSWDLRYDMLRVEPCDVCVDKARDQGYDRACKDEAERP